jgi:hypothetical protein
MSFFKKKENEFSTGKKRPKLKPVGGDAKEKAGASGKGGGQPAEPKYDVNAKGWSDQVAKFNAKGGINNDGRFGYGYVDTQTGIEVPWYIDMINGGGANAAGDTFVSPFEDAPMGGGLMGIGSQAISGGLNAMGVAPYGSNRPRYFMPMEAARVDAEGKPVQVDLGAAPTGGGSPTVTPAPQTGVLPTAANEPIQSSYSMPTQIGNSGLGMMGAFAVPQTAGPIMAGHNLPPIQGAAPSEQALREKAVQLYGQGFANLTPSSQRLILQGLAQGMGNAN